MLLPTTSDLGNCDTGPGGSGSSSVTLAGVGGYQLRHPNQDTRHCDPWTSMTCQSAVPPMSAVSPEKHSNVPCRASPVAPLFRPPWAGGGGRRGRAVSAPPFSRHGPSAAQHTGGFQFQQTELPGVAGPEMLNTRCPGPP